MDEQTIKNAYHNLPDLVREIIDGSEWETSIRKITNDYKLLINQGLILEDATLLVMLGLEDSSEFVQKISKEAEIEPMVAKQVGKAIEKEVFSKIRQALQEETRKPPEENLIIEETKVADMPPAPTYLDDMLEGKVAQNDVKDHDPVITDDIAPVNIHESIEEEPLEDIVDENVAPDEDTTVIADSIKIDTADVSTPESVLPPTPDQPVDFKDAVALENETVSTDETDGIDLNIDAHMIEDEQESEPVPATPFMRRGASILTEDMIPVAPVPPVGPAADEHTDPAVPVEPIADTMPPAPAAPPAPAPPTEPAPEPIPEPVAAPALTPTEESEIAPAPTPAPEPTPEEEPEKDPFTDGPIVSTPLVDDLIEISQPEPETSATKPLSEVIPGPVSSTTNEKSETHTVDTDNIALDEPSAPRSERQSIENQIGTSEPTEPEPLSPELEAVDKALGQTDFIQQKLSETVIAKRTTSNQGLPPTETEDTPKKSGYGTVDPYREPVE